MASSNIFLVFVLCIICSIPTIVSKKDITQIPGLNILSNVEIRKDNQTTSLSKMFGSIPAKWSVDSDNFGVIADMSLTAQCCVYSSQIMIFLQTIEYDFAKCEIARNEIPPVIIDDNWETINNFINCVDSVKSQFKSWQAITLKMLTTVLNYTKVFNTRADKNALNAIMSFYLFVSGIKKEKAMYNMSIQPNQFEPKFYKRFIKMKMYTRNLIESFAVWNCSWKAFDGDKSNKIDYPDKTIVYQFSLPETYFKRKHFDLETLFLTKVSKIPYISPRKLKMENGRSEHITKNQTIMFESIAMTVFYFIRGILKRSENKGKALLRTDDVVTQAIDMLSRFNFPGFLHVKLRSVWYQKIIDINNNKALNKIFKNSKISSDEINDRILIENDGENPVKMYVNILQEFTDNIQVMESDIKAVSEINKNLCDYDYEEVGFFQYDALSKCNHGYVEYFYLERAKPNLISLKDNSCQFSIVAVVHFILNDFIISQCESITLDANNLHMSKQLKSCLTSCINSIVSIGEILDYWLNTILKTLDLTCPYNIGNRKLIDSILAMKLYFGNGNLLNSNVPLTELGSVDINGVSSKLETLKRSHRFIINLVECFTINKCPTPSTREEFTKTTNTLLYESCSTFMKDKDKTQLIKCVMRLAGDNLKNYETDKSQTNRNDFTVESLLMHNILNKALTENSSLSILHDIDVLWDGHHKRLTEIVDFVKHNINPKYLCKYQLTMIKAFFFIAYHHMKIIVETSEQNDNFSLYTENRDSVLNALGFILDTRCVPMRIMQVYKIIFKYFEEYLARNASVSKNALSRIIEVEQYYLGLQKGYSDVKEDDIIALLPDHVLEMTFESPDVEMMESSDSKMDIDGAGNIKRLLAYSKEAKKSLTSMSNILLLLNLREMHDLYV